MGTLEIGTGIRNYPLPQMTALSPGPATCLSLCHPPVPCGVDSTYVGSIRTAGAGLAWPVSACSMERRRLAWICRNCVLVTLNWFRHSCAWRKRGCHLGRSPVGLAKYPNPNQDKPALSCSYLLSPVQTSPSLSFPRAGLSPF